MTSRARPEPRAGAVSAALVLLAFGSGAVDAFSFAALGGVFTSVMTGNLVLLGIAIVHSDAGAAVRSAVSITLYALSVLIAARALRGALRPPGEGPAEARWPGGVTAALAVVAGAQAVVLAGWLATAGRPGTVPQVTLIAVAALAMGTQSTAVNTLAVRGGATTYLTGTLTALMTELATTGPSRTKRRRFGVLAAALTGAALDAVLITWARPAAPALPLAATLTAVAAATAGRRR